MYSDLSINKSSMNMSTNRILGGVSFIRGNENTVLNVNDRTKMNMNKMNQPPEESKLDESQFLVSQSISLKDPNDFGYYNLVKPKDENFYTNENYNKPKVNNISGKAVVQKGTNKSLHLFSGKVNLLKKMNELEYNGKSGFEEKLVKSNKELIYQFAREENDYKNFEISSKAEINEINGKGDLQSVNSKKSRKLAYNPDDVQQTLNSFIMKKQNYEISNGNREHAYQLNFEYVKKKERFEINLILILLKKYENSTKPGSKITLRYPAPYQELKRDSNKLIEKFKKTSLQDKYFLSEIRNEALRCIVGFIKRIENEVDDKPTKSNDIEVKQFKNYSIWKKKISELVNIWDLYQSNGIELRFPIKYLILKRFLSNRADRRQNEAELGGSNNESKNNLGQLFNDLFGGSGSKFVPRSIIMPDEWLNVILELLFAFVLVYSLFEIPIWVFMNYQTDTLNNIDKFIDVIFFVEITMNFRKAYKDKNNEFIYSLPKILYNYLNGMFLVDFLSTIPWYFFAMGNDVVYTLIKNYVMCFKILRMAKLGVISDRMEKLKGITYFRLLKLVFLFFFFSHWLGCILFSSIKTSLLFAELIDTCYTNNYGKTKDNITFICSYYFSVYNAANIIPGQYTNSMTGVTILANTNEYLIYIFEYLMGQILAAYIFGGMASIIQNLDQGKNLFSNKMDMLTEHMMFYNVDGTTMSDVKIYFDYLWQRHKDVIYGKYHFDLLSKSLREKFERLNLPGNEILLAKFYNLNPGNSKVIGTILMNLSKVILFPFEILFEVGSVSKGIYILLNGDLTLSNEKIQNIKASEHIINYADVITLMHERENNKENIKSNYYSEKDSVIFPLISAFIKTGRNWQRSHSQNFTDLLFLPMEAFDQLLFNFPIEMHLMKHHMMEWVHKKKLFDNRELFKILTTHSSRSVSKYFQKEYDKISIWIPIPIPISQRKIAANYIESFIKKVRNHYREILLMGDLNMSLNSNSAVSLMKNSGKKDDKENKETNRNDPLDNIKMITKEILKMTSDVLGDMGIDEEDNDY